MTMENYCNRKPPLKLLEGLNQFNRGEYYECHETLEDIWRDEQGRIRNLYKGILQVGVAIFHAKRSNLSGAVRLVSSGIELLAPFAPECMGIDVAQLLESARTFRDELKRIETGKFASVPDLPPQVIPVIKFAGQPGRGRNMKG